MGATSCAATSSTGAPPLEDGSAPSLGTLDSKVSDALGFTVALPINYARVAVFDIIDVRGVAAKQ